MRENVIGRWLQTTFGFRGRQNILAWAVAGGLAYYYFYLPEKRKEEQHRIMFEEKRRYYEEKGLWDVDKAKPIPDKQQYGLVVGTGQQPQQESGSTAPAKTGPAAAANSAPAAQPEQ